MQRQWDLALLGLLLSTVNNYADLFTKTLKPGSFTSMRNKIMNIKSM